MLLSYGQLIDRVLSLFIRVTLKVNFSLIEARKIELNKKNQPFVILNNLYHIKRKFNFSTANLALKVVRHISIQETAFVSFIVY